MSEPVETPVPPRKRPPVWVIALVAVVVIAGVGFGGYLLWFAADAEAPGDCVSVAGLGEEAKMTAVGCAEKSATFKVASKRDKSDTSCPEGAYREIRDEQNLTCLMPNFIAGNCYVSDDTNQAFKVAACDNTEALKVTRVINGSTDPSGCPDGNGLGYPQPPTVFCVETPAMP